MNKRSRSVGGPRDPERIAFARDQRACANEFSRAVWAIIRNRGCRGQKFRREYPIPPYTADFCCVALKLILEVDCEHHQTDAGRQHDLDRDQFLAELGYTVIRILGFELIRDPEGVRDRMERAIDKRLESCGHRTSGTD